MYTFRFRFRRLSSSWPCKRPKQRAASVLFRQRELNNRNLCLHTTDQSYAQDSANLQQYVLLRNKLATQVVIRATEGFNLQCNNVATQVEEKCCLYYRPLLMTAFFRRFSITFRRFQKILQNLSEVHTNVAENFQKCPKMSEDCRRLSRKTRRCFGHTPTNLSTI